MFDFHKLMTSLVPGYLKLPEQRRAYYLSSCQACSTFPANGLTKKNLQEWLQSAEIHQAIQIEITQIILAEAIEPLTQWDDARQKLICAHAHTQELVRKLLQIEENAQRHQQQQQRFFPVISRLVLGSRVSGLSLIEPARSQAIQAWRQAMDSTEFFKEINLVKTAKEQSIELARERLVKRWVDYLPLLHQKSPVHQRKFSEELMTELRRSDKDSANRVHQVIKACLKTRLMDLIQPEEGLNLEPLVTQVAENFAIVVEKGFQSNTDIKELSFPKIEEMMDQVRSLVIPEQQLINTPSNTNFENALSFLWTNPLVAKTRNVIEKLADAHAFMHAVGYAMHAENTFFSILDIFNYGRYQHAIEEARSMIFGLLEPLMPLYLEYKWIAHHEKSGAARTLRMLMPLLIVCLVPTLLSLILAPLALPEIALTLLFIPALCFGFAAANYYVIKKTQIYNAIRSWWYGGPLAIPEYQVNPRLIEIFGEKHQAVHFKNYYISLLQRTSAQLDELRAREQRGTLSDQELITKQSLIKYQEKLLLDWYDIHSNPTLGIDTARAICRQRIQAEKSQTYQRLNDQFKQQESHLRTRLSEITKKLRILLTPQPTDSRDESVPTLGQDRYRLFTSNQCSQARQEWNQLEQFEFKAG